MKNIFAIVGFLVVLCSLSLWSIHALLTASPSVTVTYRKAVPQEKSAERSVPESGKENVPFVTEFEEFGGKPSGASGFWPSFRGPEFDNTNHEDFALAESWPESGPPVLWSFEALGEGHAGVAVLAGRVFMLDYDEEKAANTLRCFSFDDGTEIWRRSYDGRVKRNHGMSRTVPAVDGRYVVTMGPKCRVMCVDFESGALKWSIDLVEEFGADVPLWYTGQCPLIDDGVAVIAPGGDALMLGFDCETGEVVWETPNPARRKMSHSSIMPAELFGRRMYLYCALGGMTAVSADDHDRGSLLWQTTAWNKNILAPSPVVISGNRILVTAGHGAGSALLEIGESSGELSVIDVKEMDKSVFACEQHTPIWYREHIFGVMPGDGGELREQFVCIDPDGNLVWTSGRERRFGLGPFMLADGKFLVLADEGELMMFRAAVDGCAELARAKVLDGRDAWAPMALVQGRLILRDSRRIVCLDLRPPVLITGEQ